MGFSLHVKRICTLSLLFLCCMTVGSGEALAHANVAKMLQMPANRLSSAGGWQTVHSPNVDRYNYLTAVAAVSANDVWAVGNHTKNGAVAQPLIEHWNSKKWSVVAAPSTMGNNGILSGVAAISADDVWAVGEQNGDRFTKTLIMHWGGKKWSVIPGANLKTKMGSLSAVAAVSANMEWRTFQALLRCGLLAFPFKTMVVKGR